MRRRVRAAAENAFDARDVLPPSSLFLLFSSLLFLPSLSSSPLPLIAML